MLKDDTVYFGHMLEIAQKATVKASGISKKHFDTNEDVQLVLAHLVQIIGEAAAQVSEQGRTAHSEIPWREITGTRNKIVHDYMGVDFDVVWEIVTRDLPPLARMLERILEAN